MPTAAQWAGFLIASFVIIQIPGPSLLFMLGRALTVGRRDALWSVVGNAAGVAGQAGLVAIGLGAVVAASTVAYTVVKLVGAAYLVWLGVQAVRHRRQHADPDRTVGPAGVAPALRTGALVGLTNPKTAVMFVALLPQFVNRPAGHVGWQVLLLGLVFSVMALVSDGLWTLAAARVRGWFADQPRRLEAMSAAGGTLMVGLGIAAAAADSA